jgi:hypothetical protein
MFSRHIISIPLGDTTALRAIIDKLELLKLAFNAKVTMRHHKMELSILYTVTNFLLSFQLSAWNSLEGYNVWVDNSYFGGKRVDPSPHLPHGKFH